MPIDLTLLSTHLKKLEAIEKALIAAMASAHFEHETRKLSEVPENHWEEKQGGNHQVFMRSGSDYVFRGVRSEDGASSSRSPASYAERNKKKRRLESVVSSPITVEPVYVSGDLSIMPKANRGDLASQLSSLAELPLEEFVVLFGQILILICNYHSEGYSHNDLKPLNILVHKSSKTAPTQVKLSDLEGHGKRSQSLGAWLDTADYTDNYLSPYVRCVAESFCEEKKHSLNCDESQDITKFVDPYATAITLLEILVHYEPSLAPTFETYKKNKAAILKKTFVPGTYTAELKLHELLELDEVTLTMINDQLNISMNRMEDEQILNDIIKQICRNELPKSEGFIFTHIRLLLHQPGLLILDASITDALKENHKQHGLFILSEDTVEKITCQINEGRMATEDPKVLTQVREQLGSDKPITLDRQTLDAVRVHLQEKELAKRKLFDIVVRIIKTCNNIETRDEMPLEEALKAYHTEFPKIVLPAFDSKIVVDDMDSSILDKLQKIKSYLTHAIATNCLLSPLEIQLFRAQMEEVRAFLSSENPWSQSDKEQLLDASSQESLLKQIAEFFNTFAKMIEPILQENAAANTLVEQLQKYRATLQDVLGADHLLVQLLVQLKAQNPLMEFSFTYLGDTRRVLVELVNVPTLLKKVQISLDVATKEMWLNVSVKQQQAAPDCSTLLSCIYTFWKQEPRAYTPLIGDSLRAMQKRFPALIFARHLEALVCIVRLTLVDQERAPKEVALVISQFYLALNLFSDTLQLCDVATHQPIPIAPEEAINKQTIKRQLVTQIYQHMHRFSSSVFLQAAQADALCYVEMVTQVEFEAMQDRLTPQTYYLIQNTVKTSSSFFDQWQLFYITGVEHGVQQIPISLEREGRTFITNPRLFVGKAVAQLTDEDRNKLKRDIETFHETVLESKPSEISVDEYLVNYYRQLGASCLVRQ